MKFTLFSKYPSFSSQTRQTKRWLWVLVAGGLVIFLAIFWGRPWLAGKLVERSIRTAEVHIEHEDYRQAQLTLEQAVQVHPESLAARRRLAAFYTSVGSRKALDAWAVVAGMDPGNMEPVFQRAKVALALQDLDMVESILASIPPDQRGFSDYLRLQAAIALAKGETEEVEASFAAMEEQMPENPAVRFGVAATVLKGGDPEKISEARDELVALARADGLRIRATLQLIQYASGQENPNRSLMELAKELTGSANTLSGSYYALLDHMQAQPDPLPADVAILMEWMADRGMPREALWWWDGLDDKVKSVQRVTTAVAWCQLLLRDWAGLQQSLGEGAWGVISPEILKMMFLANEQREAKTAARAMKTWSEALDLVTKRNGMDALMVGERLANKWGWAWARETVLWRGHRLFPADRSYLRKLAALAEAEGNSADLVEIYRAWTGALPADVHAWASRLYVEMLRGKNLDEVKAMASTLMEQPDVVPEVGLIWARLEARKGNGDHALKRLSDLGLDVTSSSRAAMLLTALLVDLGQMDRAKDTWMRAKTLEASLPEERALWEALAARIE